MFWERDILTDKILLAVGRLMFFFSIFALLYGQSFLFLGFLVGVILIYGHNWYIENIGKEFVFQNEKKIQRINIEEKGEWRLSFLNNGLPILKGVLTITFNNKVEPLSGNFQEIGSTIHMNIPFRAWKREAVTVTIPYSAKQRGIAAIQKIEVKILHMFGSGVVIMENKRPVNTKIYVYPKRKRVAWKGKEKLHSQGLQNDPNSLFFNPSDLIGTREYQTGDAFQHIHWKASARMQVLQTKVYSNVSSKNWLFILNVECEGLYPDSLENFISFLAYVVDFALNGNIPFTLVSNVRSSLDIPYYYLKEGEGGVHGQKAFDFLSAISSLSLNVPVQYMMKHLETQALAFSTIVYFGKSDPKTMNTFSAFKQAGSSVFVAEAVSGQGVIKAW
ncbi:DUF58 domain-containing protein [Heyndrickxia acidicola]|uniref:DUF58 domain-containing protein n=1 Tax=Heyndrickxia acidicola TaxID=209389 RepID=A0ABU6MIW9_9BACI|nr:DUF58 domain-containing protein [Heyndrickxia acidicola]MED1204269.1 DUF58 domain-containing protein [Heyndrickxia acidicola]